MTEQISESPATSQRRALEGDDGLGEIIMSLERPSGLLRFRDWEITYVLDAPTADDLNEKIPGDWGFDPKPGYYGLTVRIWEGVTEPFHKIVLYHEIQEATCAAGDAADYRSGGPKEGRMTPHEAHEIATPLHKRFARQVLSVQELEQFQLWDSRLEHH